MGCHAGDALEQATEECVAFVADLPADFLHGCGGALQAPLGVFNAQSLDVLDGSQPGGGSEPPLECTLGEPGAADDFIDGAGDREVRAQPFLGMPDLSIVMRSEEHTSELQSLMRISYAVFCLKKNIIHYNNINECK